MTLTKNLAKGVIWRVAVATLIAVFVIPDVVLANNARILNTPFYSTAANECTSAVSVSAGGNLDYAGNPVFTDAQLELVNQNQSVYTTAATQVDIPWQIIAVIHKNESGLGRTNPGNGQGIYQFVSGAGGPYPAGPVSEPEFLRQTIFMAEQLKNSYSQRTPITANRVLTASGTPPDALKDMFFSYNGRATVYATQAEQLGYDRQLQPFEGSPYVMNKADAQRDPAVNTTTWGQIKRDFKGIEYPANNFHGAFVSYTALAGGSGGNCTNGGTVVEVAQQELAKGVEEEPDDSDRGPIVDIYNKNSAQPWCAYFLSYVFEQAGRPLPDGPTIASVDGIRAMAEANNYWYPVGSPGFIPSPGDIVVYDQGLAPFPSHVNLVVAYDQSNNQITTIGGNESNSVKQGEFDANLEAITGYVRIP